FKILGFFFVGEYRHDGPSGGGIKGGGGEGEARASQPLEVNGCGRVLRRGRQCLHGLDLGKGTQNFSRIHR
ncbi:MAG: hypothetical protein RLZZ146_765, partial [Bacteroidota bacterium]